MFKKMIVGVLIATVAIAAGFSIYNTNAAKQPEAQAAELAPDTLTYPPVETNVQAANQETAPVVAADAVANDPYQSLGSMAGNMTDNLNWQSGSGRAGQAGQGGQGTGQGGAGQTGQGSAGQGSSGQGAGSGTGRPDWAGGGGKGQTGQP